MSLKKSLFTLTFVNLLLAVILSAVVFWSCTKLSAALDPSDVQIVVGADAITKTEFPEPTAGTAVAGNVLAVLQFCLPILFFIVALILTASLFYRWKLKEPLAILMDGANRMMENDLDFTIPSVSGDELGQLCVAFETMRQSLLNSNRELWRQTEERKRLNAAFSHDLRNPITVLKGSAKMAKQCADSGNTPQLMDNLERMEAYTGRIERYVETMSKVQRLEQVQPEKVTFDTAALSADLEKALGFSAADHGKQLYFHGLSAGGTVTLDKGMLFQVAENLTTNALRFAKENVSVELSIEGENLKLEIADDGDGFPAELLKSGIQPFRKGTEEAEHLGMGLYICNLLCRKHGGTGRERKTGAIEEGSSAMAMIEDYRSALRAGQRAYRACVARGQSPYLAVLDDILVLRMGGQICADAIVAAKRSISLCPVCQNLTAGGLCPICSSPKRDNSVICVVADPRDVAAMERGREFNGKYHVLHGVISPMNHVGPDDIAIKPLLERVAQGGVEEVIMATNPDTEGEATALYLARLLKPFGTKVTRLAYGIPVGGHLEFADDATLMRALEGRREL